MEASKGINVMYSPVKQFFKIVSSPFIILTLAMCSQGQNDVQKTADINPVVFHEIMDSLDNEQLLDVRTPAEWATGTIPQALTINWYDQEFQQKVNRLDKERVVLVYCAVGGRSGQAMRKLKEMGFKEIYNLKGGIKAWKSASYEVVK